MAREPLSVSQAKARLRLAGSEVNVMKTLRSSPAATAIGAFALGLALGIPKLRRIVFGLALGKPRPCRREETPRPAK